MKPKNITLEAWGKANYDPPPSMWTLRRWARDGEIHPMPEKVGKFYYVREDARRLTGAADDLVSRLQATA